MFLNSKLDTLDNFPYDGTVFPTAWKKLIKELKAKKISEGRGAMRTPSSRHLVAKEPNVCATLRSTIAGVTQRDVRATNLLYREVHVARVLHYARQLSHE